jgi:hypothetical protein
LIHLFSIVNVYFDVNDSRYFSITQPNKKKVIFFPKLNSTFFHRFSVTNYDFLPEAARDRKASATIHTKKFKGPQNSTKRLVLWHFVWEIMKAPATNVALLLWPARSCSVLSFFPARQVSEIILNESSKCPNWVTPKRYNKIFPDIQSITWFLW